MRDPQDWQYAQMPHSLPSGGGGGGGNGRSWNWMLHKLNPKFLRIKMSLKVQEKSARVSVGSRRHRVNSGNEIPLPKNFDTLASSVSF